MSIIYLLKNTKINPVAITFPLLKQFSNLCYQEIEQMYFIKCLVSVYSQTYRYTVNIQIIYVFVRRVLCSPRLHLFEQKYIIINKV